MEKQEYLPVKASFIMDEMMVNLDISQEAKEKLKECYNKSLSISRPKTVYFDEWESELRIYFSNEKYLTLKLEDILKEHEEAIYELMKDQAQVHKAVVKATQTPTKKVILNKCWGGFDLSVEAKELYARRRAITDPKIIYDEATRSDPVLVQIVEELGKEANGQYADLVIVEIPADMEYMIDEYDGWETLHQKVQEW